MSSDNYLWVLHYNYPPYIIHSLLIHCYNENIEYSHFKHNIAYK